LQRLGHQVRLIPAQYVKPFVKRGKSDRIDAGTPRSTLRGDPAEAIAEAASRPEPKATPGGRYIGSCRCARRSSRRGTPRSKLREAPPAAMLLSVRALLVRRRTQVANALRGHAAEFGVVAAKGIGRIEALMAAVEAAAMPPPAKQALALLAARLDQLDAELAALDRRLAALHAATPLSRLLAAVPGIGPSGFPARERAGVPSALTLALGVTPERFANGRHFAAWLGLTGLPARERAGVPAEAARHRRPPPPGTPRSVLRGDPVAARPRRKQRAGEDDDRADRRTHHPVGSHGQTGRCDVREAFAKPIWASFMGRTKRPEPKATPGGRYT
jgi:transposase